MQDILESKPIFSFSRRGFPEVVVHGVTAFKTQGKPLQGDTADCKIVTRSLLKPWQAMGAAAENINLKDWTMAISSHSGQMMHLENLNALLEMCGAKETELVCPRSFPLDPNLASLARSQGAQPSRLAHPCAGKHLLMIDAAKKEQAPVENYWHDDHPVQKRIQALVGKEASEKLSWVPDSCGLPVAVMSIRALLNMYERFALDLSPQAVALKESWVKNPRLIGGVRRLDSDITENSNGSLIAKEGADGLLVVQSLPVEGNSVTSFFVKISSGYNSAHTALALWSALTARPVLPRAFEDLREYLRSRLEEWSPKDQQYANLLRPEQQ